MPGERAHDPEGSVGDEPPGTDEAGRQSIEDENLRTRNATAKPKPTVRSTGTSTEYWNTVGSSTDLEGDWRMKGNISPYRRTKGVQATVETRTRSVHTVDGELTLRKFRTMKMRMLSRKPDRVLYKYQSPQAVARKLRFDSSDEEEAEEACPVSIDQGTDISVESRSSIEEVEDKADDAMAWTA